MWRNNSFDIVSVEHAKQRASFKAPVLQSGVNTELPAWTASLAANKAN